MGTMSNFYSNAIGPHLSVQWMVSFFIGQNWTLFVEMDICVASPRLDSLMLRGSVELAWTLLKGHLMLQDNDRLYTDIESTC